jgi:pyrroloquinoline quinone (PQQ) biosynthesis protein C
VLAEESDINKDGTRQSHFEMYLEAMRDIGSSTKDINQFIGHIQHGTDVFLVIAASDLPKSVKSFLIFTFNTIYNKGLHQIASTFTFGREELIPEMFSEVIEQIQQKFPNENISNLKYYFKRHIEIDADVHGPMAINLIKNLCQDNNVLWNEVEKTAQKALKKRIKLWDGILTKIKTQKAIA